MPDVDFPTFRAAAHRLLDSDAFDRVDAVYRATLTAARSEAHTLQVLARAAQAGFFLEGTLLRVRLYQHRGRAGFSMRPRLPAPVVARLRTLCAPAAAVAVAIRVATGLSGDVLVRLRVGDLIDRGQDIDISASGGLWRVPAPIVALVRAAVADHPAATGFGGQPPSDLPLFARDDAPMPADDAAAAQLSGRACRCRPRRSQGWGRDGRSADRRPAAMGQDGGAMRRLSIDWTFIEQRRSAAGLTRAQLADRIGATGETWLVKLWHDRAYDDMPLGILEELCHVLDLHPAELFSPPTRAADRAPGTLAAGRHRRRHRRGRVRRPREPATD